VNEDSASLLEETEEFPTPKHFILTPVTDGAYQRALPTVSAIYLNAEKQPDGHFLMGMTGVSLDRHDTDTTKLLMHLFIQPYEDREDEEGAQVFTDTCGFELSAGQKTIDEFWENVAKVKSFTLAISCDEYYFHCRVDSESTMVTDVKCDWRFLN
jgi:hypothetical protein